jgi:large subunit ribosomal protein L9
MPKTQIILTQSVPGLGAESDQVKVAAGYARNFLFPQGLAIPLTAANKRRLEVLRQRRAEREALEFNTMSELARSLSKMVLALTVKTGDDGKMFGAVTPGTIADEMKHQFDVSIDKKKIHLEHPLKLGEHDVELRLHPSVTTSLKVRVNSDQPVAPSEEAPGAESRGREAVTEKRKGPPEKARVSAAKGEDKKERAPRKPRIEKKEKTG